MLSHSRTKITTICDHSTQVEDNDEAADYGISLLPALVYFENRIPSLYDDDLAKVKSILLCGELIIIILCNVIFSSTLLVAFSEMAVICLKKEANINAFRLDIFRGEFLEGLFYGQ